MWSSFQCTIVIYLVMNAFINVCLIQGIETVNVKNSFSKQWNSGLQNSQSLEYWIPLFIVENWAEFIIFSEAAEHLGSVLDCKSGKPASSVARAILWFSSDNCSMSRCASDVLCGEVNSVSTNFATLISFHRSNLLCVSTVNKLSEKEIKKNNSIHNTVKSNEILQSVQFNHSVVSDSLQPHGLQHARPPCPSPTPGAYPHSCALSWWCHPTISSSVVPFASCLQSFRASGSFLMSLHIRWPKYQSFSFNISPSNEHPGLISFRMDWLDLLAVQGTLKSLLQYRSSKELILLCSAFFIVQLSHPYMTTGKTITLTR